MKKVGIITILKCNNFGAELQAYATQKKLRLMGYDAEIIDMLYYKHPDFKKTKLSRPFVKQTMKEKVTEFVKFSILNPIIYNIIPLFSKKMRIRNKKFDNFHKENTKLSKTYRTIDSLYNKCDDYDAYIVGSDQVWNPGTGMNIEPYFLSFTPKGKKRISYASSFGVTRIPIQYVDKFKKLLNGLDFISVREEAGVKIVEEVAQRKAELVLDPTLLLDKEEWKKCSSGYNPNNEGYVLIYEVHPSEKIQQLALDYAQKNNLPVYRVGVRGMFNWETKGITNLVDIGPADFVSLFENADIVFTNSFHGTAFSVNLGRNFYTVLSRAGKKNSRMTSLLSIMELESRILFQEDDEKISYEKYDVSKVQELLKAEREKSIGYLKTALN
jgi:hypothetical protein